MPRESKYVSFEDEGLPTPSFGPQMRKELQLEFDAGSGAFCNQGGYGICPKRVVDFR